ncbi:hypothetical protein [Roseobacter sp. N2S]|uniref:hypothetical protein n=1 Tax=Roseobacter sp. N2S TaxID=2663844 RepID=UPI00285D974C|nr:hypothetical protein [Roseobacter sp. N2S]MDR6266546.1 hypothetical protein [Roseobacter sp. N2S]
MCVLGKQQVAAPTLISARDNSAARAEASRETRRRRGASAAANVLTSPIGLPSGRSMTTELGGVAA